MVFRSAENGLFFVLRVTVLCAARLGAQTHLPVLLDGSTKMYFLVRLKSMNQLVFLNHFTAVIFKKEINSS